MKTVSNYMNKLNDGSLSLEHIVQRAGGMWTKKQKQEFIVNVIHDTMPISPIHVYENEKSNGEIVEEVIDGKQRLLALQEFLNGGFELPKDAEPLIDGKEKYELAGRRCKSTDKVDENKKKTPNNIIDDKVVNKLKEVNIMRYIYKAGKEEDVHKAICELFYALNNGTPLTADQKLKAILSREVLTNTLKIIDTNLFKNTVTLSKAQKAKSQDITIVLQAAMLIEGKVDAFSSKNIENFAKTFNNLETLDIIKSNCDFLYNHFKEQQDVFKKVNLPMIIASVSKNTRSKDEFIDSLNKFISGYNDNEEYKQHCTSGTAGKQKVIGRWNYFLENIAHAEPVKEEPKEVKTKTRKKKSEQLKAEIEQEIEKQEQAEQKQAETKPVEQVETKPVEQSEKTEKQEQPVQNNQNKQNNKRKNRQKR